jgi:hypothetical protein
VPRSPPSSCLRTCSTTGECERVCQRAGGTANAPSTRLCCVHH